MAERIIWRLVGEMLMVYVNKVEQDLLILQALHFSYFSSLYQRQSVTYRISNSEIVIFLITKRTFLLVLMQTKTKYKCYISPPKTWWVNCLWSDFVYYNYIYHVPGDDEPVTIYLICRFCAAMPARCRLLLASICWL